MSLESRIDALERQAGAGQPELVIIDVVEVDVDGSEEVRKTLTFYVDPATKRRLNAGPARAGVGVSVDND